MPVLSKAAHERMAQLMAQGKAPSVAYGMIRPKCKDPSANVTRFLKMHPEIEQRVAEIATQDVIEGAVVVSRSQELAAMDKAYILRNLKEIIERCMQSRPVLDRDGDQVFVELPSGKVAAAYGFDPRAATRALHLAGLEIGMFVQRHSIMPDIFAGLPAPVVQQIMEALVNVRAGRLIEDAANASPALTPALARGASA